jgi:hypothetical protein
MIIEAAFIGLLVAAWKKSASQGKLTPEREEAYIIALETVRGEDAPRIFRKMADGFEKYGLPIQAKTLRTRADYLDTPSHVKDQRRDIIVRAMKSVNADAVEGVAAEFEKLTATGIARDLRDHARAIREGRFPPPSAVSPEPAKEEQIIAPIPSKEERLEDMVKGLGNTPSKKSKKSASNRPPRRQNPREESRTCAVDNPGPKAVEGPPGVSEPELF